MGGLHFIDLSSSRNAPKLLTSVDINSGAVQVQDGVAYAAVGGQIESFDLLTGEAISTLSLGGGSITGLTNDGAFLYSIDSNNVVRVVDIGGISMIAAGRRDPAGGRRRDLRGGRGGLRRRHAFHPRRIDELRLGL